MSKKKAVVCTILFVIALYGIIFGLSLIKTYDGTYSAFTVFSYAITGIWIADSTEKFYKWLIK